MICRHGHWFTHLSTSSVTREYGIIFEGLLPHRLQEGGLPSEGRLHLMGRTIAHMTLLTGK